MDIIYIINDFSITLLRKDVCKFTELFDMLYSSNYLFIMLHLLLLNSAVHHNALVRYCCVNEKECKHVLSISMNSKCTVFFMSHSLCIPQTVLHVCILFVNNLTRFLHI